jgi:hypothetical protein
MDGSDDRRRVFTFDDAKRIAETATLRAVTELGLHEFMPPEGLVIEHQDDPTQEEGDATYDSIPLTKIMASYVAATPFTYKTSKPARSCDFFINAPWMQNPGPFVALEDGVPGANKGDFARVELYALHGSTRSLISTGIVTGCAPQFTTPQVTTLGFWMASGRVAKPCQWEAVLYFVNASTSSAVPNPGPTNIALVTDPRSLPEAPPSLGTLQFFGTVRGFLFPCNGAAFQGGLAPPRLVSVSGMDLVNAVRYIQINTTTASEVEVPLAPNAAMVSRVARDLELVTLTGSTGGNLNLRLSTTPGVFTNANNGDAWWSITVR